MLTLQGVQKNRGGDPVLDAITLKVEAGKVLCILGPSGCGKTTLLHLMAGLEPISGGRLENQSPATAYMFQEDRLVPWQSVFDNIALVKKKKDAAAVLDLIGAVGLKGFEQARPQSLSGGMKQRCAFARALYYDAPLLLMDEPFKSLDVKLQKRAADLLLAWQEKKEAAVVFVTHDVDEALALGDEIIVLSERPAQILDRVQLPMAKKGRCLNASNLQEIKERLVRSLTNESR